MAISMKLCNPTPFEAVIPYDKGVNIRIPAFGSVGLTMNQLDDFKSGKPGSEAVEVTLNYYGLFLEDSDRPYDSQAVEALERCRDAKKAQYDAAFKRLQDNRSAQGIGASEEDLEPTLHTMNYVAIREQVEVLTEQITKYKSIIGPEREKAVRPQFDPARTVFVLDPPREFPSVAAMEFFLEQNQEIAVKHQALQNQGSDATPTRTPPPFDFELEKS